MTLRLKINLIVGALMLAFLGGLLVLQLRALQDSVREEVVAANRVAAQLLNRTAWLYAAQGTGALRAYLQGLGRVRANEITLLDNAGAELYRSPPSPYKSGRDAPDWFAALLAPPPSQQAIAFPDGKLVVQGNASRAVLDAWDNLWPLVAGALAALLAAQALVAWLVGRAVAPLAQIADALAAVRTGGFDTLLPALPGREAGAIGAAFNHMTTGLRQQVETEKRAALAEAQLSDSRELARWVGQHIEQERRLIARELHDELGQSVTAMRALALGVAQQVQASHAEPARAAQLIADEASRLYDAMHGIILRLAPPVLDRLGLADALQDLAQRTRRAHPQVALTLSVDLGDQPLEPDAALAVYRTAQEGITNALRHGGAQAITLQLQAGAQGIALSLADDGRGPPPQPDPARAHHGLAWLAERAQALGGTLALSPVQPHGALLRLQLPRGAP
jgi:two-component system sensor histidine kinase UhpB